MAGTIKYDNGTLTTLIDQTGSAPNTLAGLAAGQSAITGSAYDNTPGTGRADFWADFEIFVTFPNAPGSNKTVDVYLLESLDGTNFADGSGGASPVLVGSHFVGNVPIRSITTAQRLVIRGVPLPPTKFNVVLLNNTDQAFASNAVSQYFRMLPYREQYT